MQPAARVGDMHVCPLITPVVPPIPHVGGPILPPGGVTVLIGGQPAARMTDICTCVGPPDFIVQGAPTVLICGLPAARMGDLTAHGGSIVMGFPTVCIGVAAGGLSSGGAAAGPAAKGSGGAAAGPAAKGSGGAAAGPGAKKKEGIVYEGTPEEQKQLKEMVEEIRNAGPKGKAFIESLENSPTKTRISIGTTATDKNGTFNLSTTGGGVTFPPSKSLSGDNEVHIDPNHLIDYQATDGTTVTETSEGLLAHELGHASLLNQGDPSHNTPGPAAEAAVRNETNDIRTELGMKPESG